MRLVGLTHVCQASTKQPLHALSVTQFYCINSFTIVCASYLMSGGTKSRRPSRMFSWDIRGIWLCPVNSRLGATWRRGTVRGKGSVDVANNITHSSDLLSLLLLFRDYLIDN